MSEQVLEDGQRLGVATQAYGFPVALEKLEVPEETNLQRGPGEISIEYRCLLMIGQRYLVTN
jgi:hypothetical protein